MIEGLIMEFRLGAKYRAYGLVERADEAMEVVRLSVAKSSVVFKESMQRLGGLTHCNN